jgi:hypothetical protein
MSLIAFRLFRYNRDYRDLTNYLYSMGKVGDAKASLDEEQLKPVADEKDKPKEEIKEAPTASSASAALESETSSSSSSTASSATGTSASRTSKSTKQYFSKLSESLFSSSKPASASAGTTAPTAVPATIVTARISAAPTTTATAAVSSASTQEISPTNAVLLGPATAQAVPAAKPPKPNKPKSVSIANTDEVQQAVVVGQTTAPTSVGSASEPAIIVATTESSAGSDQLDGKDGQLQAVEPEEPAMVPLVPAGKIVHLYNVHGN